MQATAIATAQPLSCEAEMWNLEMPSRRASSAAESRSTALGAPDSDDTISMSRGSRSLIPRPRHFITASFAAHRVASRFGSPAASAHSSEVQPRARNADPPSETRRFIRGIDTTSTPTRAMSQRSPANAAVWTADVNAADGVDAAASTPLIAVLPTTSREHAASAGDPAQRRPMSHEPPAHRTLHLSVHTRSA